MSTYNEVNQTASGANRTYPEYFKQCAAETTQEVFETVFYYYFHNNIIINQLLFNRLLILHMNYNMNVFQLLMLNLHGKIQLL